MIVSPSRVFYFIIKLISASMLQTDANLSEFPALPVILPSCQVSARRALKSRQNLKLRKNIKLFRDVYDIFKAR